MSIMNITIDTGGAVGVAASPPKVVETAKIPPVEPPAQAATDRQLVIQHQSLEASYYYDRQLNQVVITLTSPETGEVVRQIPQEQVRRFLIGMMELAGRFFDARV
jgi:uncharacterized FlaG/YvyC family protein